MTHWIDDIALWTSAFSLLVAALTAVKVLVMSCGWAETKARLKHAMRELDDDHVRMWRFMADLAKRLESAGIPETDKSDFH